jgi:5-methylcytosine-specific restriction endonuclease McrA
MNQFFGRPPRTKWEQVWPGVRRIKDQFADHPDGYRYKLSPAEMKKVVDKKIREQDAKCALCGEPFEDYSNVAPDHIKPKGMGGARADDRAENIQAAHNWPCNLAKGSCRI